MGANICYICDNPAVAISKISNIPICRDHKNWLETISEFEEEKSTDPMILLPDNFGRILR